MSLNATRSASTSWNSLRSQHNLSPKPKITHQVLPAVEEDIPRLTDIQFAAFGDDPTHQIPYPGDRLSSTVRGKARERTLKLWRETPEMHVTKCVESGTGVISGIAKWTFYKTPRSEEEWNVKPTASWAEERHRVVVEQLLATTAEIRGRRWGGKPHALLGLLCVHPDFQRRGVGKELVQWGLRQAADTGLAVHLEASPEGLSLYRSLGFNVVETVVVEADQWDGGFERQYIVMLWEPMGTFPKELSVDPVV